MPTQNPNERIKTISASSLSARTKARIDYNVFTIREKLTGENLTEPIRFSEAKDVVLRGGKIGMELKIFRLGTVKELENA